MLLDWNKKNQTLDLKPGHLGVLLQHILKCELLSSLITIPLCRQITMSTGRRCGSPTVSVGKMNLQNSVDIMIFTRLNPFHPPPPPFVFHSVPAPAGGATSTSAHLHLWGEKMGAALLSVDLERMIEGFWNVT